MILILVSWSFRILKRELDVNYAENCINYKMKIISDIFSAFWKTISILKFHLSKQERKNHKFHFPFFRYACWLWLGVILTNGQFLYRVHYLLCSALGVFISPFFYAFHLIDVVLSFPMLKAILQSVTHNLQQVIISLQQYYLLEIFEIEIHWDKQG